MVAQLNTSVPMLKLIQLGIQRCDGPERHRMLTVINAYYGYYEILLIHQILHQFIKFCIDSSDLALI